jgi:hypothetical protein
MCRIFPLIYFWGGEVLNLTSGRNRTTQREKCTLMAVVGFEDMTPMFECAKSVHGLESATTVIAKYST